MISCAWKSEDLRTSGNIPRKLTVHAGLIHYAIDRMYPIHARALHELWYSVLRQWML